MWTGVPRHPLLGEEGLEAKTAGEGWVGGSRGSQGGGGGAGPGHVGAPRPPPPTVESQLRGRVLTAASLSKRAKSSLSSFTSSWALQAEDSWVKPTISAKRMLEGRKAQQ